MEERSDFIWEMIENIPVLRQKIQSLEAIEPSNHYIHIAEYIDFFKEIDLMLDEIKKDFQIPNTQHPTLSSSKPETLNHKTQTMILLPPIRFLLWDQAKS